MIPIALRESQHDCKPATLVMIGGVWCIGKVWCVRGNWFARAYECNGVPAIERKGYQFKRDAVYFIRRRFENGRNSRFHTTAASGVNDSNSHGYPYGPRQTLRSCGGVKGENIQMDWIADLRVQEFQTRGRKKDDNQEAIQNLG